MQYTSVFVICCCVRFHEEYEYDTSCKMFVLQARTSCVIYYICARAHNEIINRKYIYISHFIVYILVHVCCGGFYIFYFAPLLPFHRYICMLYVQLTRKTITLATHSKINTRVVYVKSNGLVHRTSSIERYRPDAYSKQRALLLTLHWISFWANNAKWTRCKAVWEMNAWIWTFESCDWQSESSMILILRATLNWKFFAMSSGILVVVRSNYMHPIYTMYFSFCNNFLRHSLNDL